MPSCHTRVAMPINHKLVKALDQQVKMLGIPKPPQKRILLILRSGVVIMSEVEIGIL